MMTHEEAIIELRGLYGPEWEESFTEESGYSYVSVWRFANEVVPMTRRMELEIERVKTLRQKLQHTGLTGKE